MAEDSNQQSASAAAVAPAAADPSQDECTFPNLFEETSRMTVACIIVFVLADLRKLARDGHLTESETQAVLTLPIKAEMIPRIWNNNQSVLKKRIRSDEYATLQYLIDRYIEELRLQPELEAGECHYCGDDKASSECVYMIVTNAIRKTIVVAFRGSVTLKDWFQDAKSSFEDVRNPLYDNDTGGAVDDTSGIAEKGQEQLQPEMLPLHNGFRDYLYGDSAPLVLSLPEISPQLQQKIKDLPAPPKISLPSMPSSLAKDEGAEAKDSDVEEKDADKEGEAESAEPAKTKIQTVLDQISLLYETRPDHKLYLTGHSLGGALAVITSLEAAARFSLRKEKPPVTCITVGNPKAAGQTFRRAIQYCERRGCLRVLAVHKMDDLVPLLPGPLCTFSILNSFCHVGIQLKLWGKDDYKMKYHGPREAVYRTELREKWRHVLLILPCLHKMKSRHFYKTYLDDIVARKDAFETMTLNEFYELERFDTDLGQ